MADGNLVRQSQNGKDSVVFGPSVYDVPLLPYERELIKTVGITEEEYKFFTAEVKKRGKLRPAEYAHIADLKRLRRLQTMPPQSQLFLGVMTAGKRKAEC